MGITTRALVDEFALRAEAIYLRALSAIAARGKDPQATSLLRERQEAADRALIDRIVPDGPMAKLAARLELGRRQINFFWAAATVSGDPRLALLLDELSGPSGRRGLDLVAYAAIARLDAIDSHELGLWLDDSANSLLARGLIVAADDASNAATRRYAVPGRVLRHLRGDDDPESPLSILTPPTPAFTFDQRQQDALERLVRVASHAADIIVVIEGPLGSGRRTAALHALARPLVTLDASGVDRRRAAPALLALRRGAFLADTSPILANVDVLTPDEPGGHHDSDLARALDSWSGPVIVTTSVPGLDLGLRRATVRVSWPVPDVAMRHRLWLDLGANGGVTPTGDVGMLAHRYRVGPGGIDRAIATAQSLLPPAAPLDAGALANGLRHNIAESLGTLARHAEVTQSWDDLVVADDLRDQLQALTARIRHGRQVLDEWGYRSKMARGTGVAALFSGPPGTGKSMCAGLVAAALDLELYIVDLSRVVSKWVGETEKQLAKVFDAAEQGHALLLFDEADALFGQRTTDVKGAVDRYANLEVNFLLQRIEAFGGITILTTNLDTTIDRALKRRLAAHIVFDAPDEEERSLLWQRLVRTGKAPIDKKVDFDDLARAFPKMTGANIRNAALAAAFLAASVESTVITMDHLNRAARVEYRAMGYVLADRAEGRKGGG